MSLFAIPAVPYIITGSMSLYLSYKTYSNYYQNIEFIELERDNKIRNQEELEEKMEEKNTDTNLLEKKLENIDDNDNDNNDNKFVSIDEEQNISIERLHTPDSTPNMLAEPLDNVDNRPPTPYPYFREAEAEAVGESLLEKIPESPIINETINELASGVSKTVIQESLDEVSETVSQTEIKEPVDEVSEVEKSPVITSIKKANKKRKRKKKRQNRN